MLDRGIQADATAYFGSVPINATTGSEVFRFRIVIDLSRFNNDLDALVVILVRSRLVESIFKFSNGQNQRTFFIAPYGGIGAVNASRVFPEIRLIENRLVVYEDSVIYHTVLPTYYDLPVVFDFELNVIVVGRYSSVIRELLPFAVGTVIFTHPPGIFARINAY